MNKKDIKDQEAEKEALAVLMSADGVPENSSTDKMKRSATRSRVFLRYQIKDIVFLAIMAAVMLVTGAIMPLITQIPVFGIIQLCLGLQFSIFPAIGLMKVRKPGALILMSLFSGVVLAFMFLPMFFCLLLCALIAEGLILIIFRGYKKDLACLLAAAIYLPLSLPFLYGYYNLFYSFTGKEGQAVTAYLGASPWVAIAISFAVLGVAIVGAGLGVLVARELKKAGVLK